MNEDIDKPKVVLVTGCSSGIGRTTAEVLAEHGYAVIATVRRAEDAEGIQLGEHGHVLLMDLAVSSSVQAAARQVERLAEGRLIAIFNNAAYGQPGAVEDLEREVLRQQFEVNLFGTHELTVALLPALLKQERAHIIQNSSILGFIGMPIRGAYVASKFALEGLSHTLRMELSDSPVQVHLIEPGPIRSQFRQNALAALEKNVDFERSRHGWRYSAALERLSKPGPASSHTLEPESVARCVLHILSTPKPRLRYRVTRPTHVMHVLVRVLPTRWVDRILLRYAKGE